MSRKDYVKLAEALSRTRPRLDTRKADTVGPARLQWVWTVVGIADTLQTDNTRFDRGRFYKACGHHES